MLPVLVTLIIFGLLATGGLLFLLKTFAKKTQGGSSNEMGEQDTELAGMDAAIEGALAYLEPMSPLSDAVQREQEIANLRNEMAVESKKLSDLDAQLSKLQKAVEAAEAAHNELKKGKEDAESIADEIRARRDELASEAKKLEGELVHSQTQLNVIAEEVNLTKDQKIALAAVHSSVETAVKQISSLTEIYTVAATRFSNLETQYRELEKEYTKLVEKELSGKFD